MRRIAHVSDLHFGNHDEHTARALVVSLAQAAPDLIAVSGDVTHTGSARQFARARRFFRDLAAPVVAVPGNHDLPLFDLSRRFLKPLGHFHAHVAADPESCYRDDELTLLGLNTARPWLIKAGRISAQQRAQIGECMATATPGSLRAVLMHHPFIPHARRRFPGLVLGRRRALAALVCAGVRVVLSGHLHIGFTTKACDHYPGLDPSLLLLQAGTALSHRLRGQPNSYNLVTIDGPRLRSEARVLDAGEFRAAAVADHELCDGRWR